MTRWIVALFACLLMAQPVRAADRPTLEDVRALTLDAAALVSVLGVDGARKTFLSPGPFRFGEIYVNVIDENGTWLVYPPNPRNEGKSVLNVTDADGVALVREIIRVAQAEGEGWVRYRWLNPASNRIEPKASFVKRVPEKGAIVYIGVYQ